MSKKMRDNDNDTDDDDNDNDTFCTVACNRPCDNDHTDDEVEDDDNVGMQARVGPTDRACEKQRTKSAAMIPAPQFLFF